MTIIQLFKNVCLVDKYKIKDVFIVGNMTTYPQDNLSTAFTAFY